MEFYPDTDNQLVLDLADLVIKHVDPQDHDSLMDVIESYSYEPIVYTETKAEILERILWVQSIQRGRELEDFTEGFKTDVDLNPIIEELTYKAPAL